jgi:hypothetical protein
MTKARRILPFGRFLSLLLLFRLLDESLEFGSIAIASFIQYENYQGVSYHILALGAMKVLLTEVNFL